MKLKHTDPYYKVWAFDEYIKSWFKTFYRSRLFTNNEQLLENHIMFAENIDYIQLYLDMGYEVIVKYENEFLCITANKLPTTYITDINTIHICNKQDRYNYFKFNRNRQIQKYPKPVHKYINLKNN